MADMVDPRTWLTSERRRRVDLAQELREEFFAERTDIPDLEFRTPDCPICGLSTTYEDESFECDGCEIVWPSSGYGHQAERYNNEGTTSDG